MIKYDDDGRKGFLDSILKKVISKKLFFINFGVMRWEVTCMKEKGRVTKVVLHRVGNPDSRSYYLFSGHKSCLFVAMMLCNYVAEEGGWLEWDRWFDSKEGQRIWVEAGLKSDSWCVVCGIDEQSGSSHCDDCFDEGVDEEE
jgi:hypothetical protein